MAHRAVKIELTAADRKHGMTLAELQTFVKAADAVGRVMREYHRALR